MTIKKPGKSSVRKARWARCPALSALCHCLAMMNSCPNDINWRHAWAFWGGWVGGWVGGGVGVGGWGGGGGVGWGVGGGGGMWRGM
mgnify:CR=1 FL=1